MSESIDRQEPTADVALWCVGCRANQADRQVLHVSLDSRGFRVTEEKQASRVYIIYSCCVTSEAERDTRRLVRKAICLNRNAKVILQGCLSNYMLSKEIKCNDIFNSSSVVLTDDPMGQVLESRAIQTLKDTGVFPDHAPNSGKPRYRPRTLIKVQNGCSRRCAYCVVPLVRGPGTSLAPSMVADRISEAFRGGAAEIGLTGVNLGDWGKDLRPKRTLLDLLEYLDNRFRHGPWIRLSSIEPWVVTKNLADFMLGSRVFCPHLHVPLQSGDPELLERMGRKTDLERLLEVLDEILAKNPGFSLGFDMIAGLPTESEQSHGKSLGIIESMGLAYLHVFGYSKRSGTRAEHMPEHPEKAVTSRRVRELILKGQEKTRRFLETQVGKTLDAIVTRTGKARVQGMTRNYLEVLMPEGATRTHREEVLGEKVKVRIDSTLSQGRYVRGTILS